MSTGVFYASNKGYAAEAAKKIAAKLGVTNVFDVKETPVKTMSDYDAVIVVVATHKVGEIQNDLAAQLDDFKAINWADKTVAIAGLGDGVTHKKTFNNAIGKVYDIVSEKNATVIGFVEDKGYVYEDTDAKRNGKFAGLPLDEINQADKTDARIEAWITAIKAAL